MNFYSRDDLLKMMQKEGDINKVFDTRYGRPK